MIIYEVEKIIEVDYGCEECPPEGPYAVLKLKVVESKAGAPEATEHVEQIGVLERYLDEAGIDAGCRIVLPEGGRPLKCVRVVAAVIRDGEKIFATARGYGEFKGGWEFPGGKIEAGETPQEALKREIMEELDAEIRVGDLIDTIEYDYPAFHLSMDCFWCEVASGELKLLEAEAARWLTKEELDSVDWLPADITIIDKIREAMGQ